MLYRDKAGKHKWLLRYKALSIKQNFYIKL